MVHDGYAVYATVHRRFFRKTARCHSHNLCFKNLERNVRRKIITKHKIVVFVTISILCLGLIGNISPLQIPEVYASPDYLPSDGDAWTENDNATYVWTVSPSYPDTIEFTTEEAQIGSYCLKINHTSTTTYIAFQLDLGTQTDFSGYDFFSFRFKWISTNLETLYGTYAGETGAFTGDRWKIGAFYLTNDTWKKLVIPLIAFGINSGTPSWTIIQYFGFMSSPIGSADGTTMYLDGLYFGDYQTPTVSNSLSSTSIPNFYAYYPKFPEKTVTKDGISYTSLYEFQDITTATGVTSDIESEVLGHVILALIIAYSKTGDATLISKARTYGDWLIQLQNSSNGGFHNCWNDGTQTLFDRESGTHNGWALAGMSYLYDATKNMDYLNSADDVRSFLCDVLWDDTNDWYDTYYTPSSGVVTDSSGWDSMRDGSIIAGLATYYRLVSTNSTVRTQIEECLTKLKGLPAQPANATYGGGDQESSTYTHWGLYEAYKAFNTDSYKTGAEYLWDMMHAQYELTTNGSFISGILTFHEYSGTYLDGWGVAINQLLAMLLYAESGSTTKKLLYEKTMFDYIETVRAEATGLDNYAISRYRKDGTYMSDRTYVPSQAFLYASLVLYQYSVVGVSTPLIINTDQLIESCSTSAETLSFVVSASSGVISTTQIDCLNLGKPKQVSGATDWSYDSSLKIATIEVYHTSAKTITVSFGGAGSANFKLSVFVTKDGFPATATANLNGENRSIYWQTTYNLPYGTYDLEVFCEGKTQMKQVGVFSDTTVGFNFETIKEQYSTNIGLIVAIPVVVILAVAMFTVLRRKR